MKRKKVTIPRIEALQARANIYCLIKNAKGLLRAKNSTLAVTLDMPIQTFKRHIAWMTQAGFLRQFDGKGKAPSVYGIGVYPLSRFLEFLSLDCYAKVFIEVDEVSRFRITIESIDRSKSDDFWSFDESSWFKEARREIQFQLLDEFALEVIKIPPPDKLQDDIILIASAKEGIYAEDDILYPCTIYVWQECEGESLFCGQPVESQTLPFKKEDLARKDVI